MTLNRRQREKKERRSVFLMAAKAVFAEKGFDAATLDEIANRAEFSKGAIYGYFKDKDDLFISLIEEGLNKLSMIIRSVVESPLPPIEKIKELIKSVLAYFDENKEFFRIFTPERGGFTDKKHPRVAKRILPKWNDNIGFVTEVIKDGIEMGVFKNIDPTTLTNALFGLVQSSISRWIMEGRKGSLKRDAEVITTIFLDGAKLQ